MNQQKPKTITLRRLEPGEPRTKQDYWVEPWDKTAGFWCAEYSPIPEGYEPCDLECATKVLIGETWCDVDSSQMISGGDGRLFATYRLEGFGVLAIRPIPEPEPMRGEARAGQLIVSGRPDSAVLYLPEHLIGKVIRWEAVKDGGE